MKFEDVIAAIPALRAAIPNITAQVLMIAATEERRREMNNLIDLGGQKCDTYQYDPTHNFSVHTVAHPVEFEKTRYRGRTYLMVVLDAAIAEEYKTSADQFDLRYALETGLLTTAKELGVAPKELFITI